MKIIALTGAKGAGKDTVAKYITKLCDRHEVTHLAFADPIKKMVQHIFGLNNITTEDYDYFKRTLLTFELPGKSPQAVDGRHVVREIGMMMRGYDEKQFTSYVESQFNTPRLSSSQSIFVVTDLRFDNEYVMLKRYGATIVKITRPGYQYDGHITERGFDDHLVDYSIENNGSLIDLKTQVNKMLQELIV